MQHAPFVWERFSQITLSIIVLKLPNPDFPLDLIPYIVDDVAANKKRKWSFCFCPAIAYSRAIYADGERSRMSFLFDIIALRKKSWRAVRDSIVSWRTEGAWNNFLQRRRRELRILLQIWLNARALQRLPAVRREALNTGEPDCVIARLFSKSLFVAFALRRSGWKHKNFAKWRAPARSLMAAGAGPGSQRWIGRISAFTSSVYYFYFIFYFRGSCFMI